mmetsp:Transcript_111216/g.325295  ORF Transcript_111216/g.325295 Transcript_111216/m.325295 type:complete len:219 (-) Transcript_111216:390-1046(-)
MTTPDGGCPSPESKIMGFPVAWIAFRSAHISVLLVRHNSVLACSWSRPSSREAQRHFPLSWPPSEDVPGSSHPAGCPAPACGPSTLHSPRPHRLSGLCMKRRRNTTALCFHQRSEGSCKSCPRSSRSVCKTPCRSLASGSCRGELLSLAALFTMIGVCVLPAQALACTWLLLLNGRANLKQCNCILMGRAGGHDHTCSCITHAAGKWRCRGGSSGRFV